MLGLGEFSTPVKERDNFEQLAREAVKSAVREGCRARLSSFMGDSELLDLVSTSSFGKDSRKLSAATCIMCNTSTRCPIHRTPAVDREQGTGAVDAALMSSSVGGSSTKAASSSSSAAAPSSSASKKSARKSLPTVSSVRSLFLGNSSAAVSVPGTAPSTTSGGNKCAQPETESSHSRTSSGEEDLHTIPSLTNSPSTRAISTNAPTIASLTSTESVMATPSIATTGKSSSSAFSIAQLFSRSRSQSADSMAALTTSRMRTSTMQSSDAHSCGSTSGENRLSSHSASLTTTQQQSETEETSPRNKRINMLISKLVEYTRISNKLNKKLVSQIILIFYYLKECIDNRPASLNFLSDQTPYCEVTLSILRVFLHPEQKEDFLEDLIDIFKFIALTVQYATCRLRFVKSGLCETLVESFTRCLQKPRVLIAQLAVLEKLTHDDCEQTQMKLVYLDMCALLLQAMTCHATDSALVSLSCHCFGNIALDMSDRKRLTCEQIVSPIVSLLLQPNLIYDCVDLVEDALAVWMEMLSNLQHRFDVDYASIIEWLLLIMQLHRLSALIVSCLAYEIKQRILASEESVVFGSESTCRSLYLLMQTYATPQVIADVLDQLLQIAHYMIRQPRNQLRFSTAGLSPLLMGLLQETVNASMAMTLAQRALSLLHFLWEHNSCRMEALKAHAARVLFDYHQRIIVLQDASRHPLPQSEKPPAESDRLFASNSAHDSDALPLHCLEQQRLLHILILQLLGTQFASDEEYERVPHAFDLFVNLAQLVRVYRHSPEDILQPLLKDVIHIVSSIQQQQQHWLPRTHLVDVMMRNPLEPLRVVDNHVKGSSSSATSSSTTLGAHLTHAKHLHHLLHSHYYARHYLPHTVGQLFSSHSSPHPLPSPSSVCLSKGESEPTNVIAEPLFRTHCDLAATVDLVSVCLSSIETYQSNSKVLSLFCGLILLLLQDDENEVVWSVPLDQLHPACLLFEKISLTCLEEDAGLAHMIHALQATIIPVCLELIDRQSDQVDSMSTRNAPHQVCRSDAGASSSLSASSSEWLRRKRNQLDRARQWNASANGHHSSISSSTSNSGKSATNSFLRRSFSNKSAQSTPLLTALPPSPPK